MGVFPIGSLSFHIFSPLSTVHLWEWVSCSPAGSSDVVAFGNAYAKSFGYSVFRQVPGSSSPSKGGGEAE